MRYFAKDLTLDEKIRLLTGVDNWRLDNLDGKLPSVFLSDGPNGLRMMNDDGTTKNATAMPTGACIANTWNKEVAYKNAATIADECVLNGADVLLAPGTNIKRTPLCGRNFEYFSEDPFLAGEIASAYVDGLQENGIGTSLKHFCVNNREYDRFFQSNCLDLRTLHEIYMKPFEICIKKSQPWTVMCSYNPVNGIYASENKKLLKTYLRDEFGFKGMVVSDWCAVHNPYKAHRACLDLEMPYNKDAFENVKNAYLNGYITQEEIDFCADNVLNLIYKVDEARKTRTVKTTKEERHQIAISIAEEAMVLLKNTDEILPLTNSVKNVLVTGDLACYPSMVGGGSGWVQTDYKVKPFHDLIKELLPNANVEYSKCIYGSGDTSGTDAAKKGLISAYGKDVVFVFVGNNATVECEGRDRYDISLPDNQVNFIKEMAKVNPNVVVILEAGSAIDVSPWIDDVKGLIYTGFCGEGMNEALANVVCGKVSPSGKLSETFPMSLEDTYTESDTGELLNTFYNDGIYVGYRYYQTAHIEPQFAFGYGLSYADFEYSNIAVEKIDETKYNVTFDVTNVSAVDAKEVSQVYVRDVFSMVNRPELELKGFEKTLIKAGETKKISIKLDYDSFAYYNEMLEKYHVENGIFEIYVGSASDDLRLMTKIEINLPDDTQQSKM